MDNFCFRMGYYISTLLICSVVHEFGHAVTSVSDDVTVIGAGIMVMIFVPAAYVELVTTMHYFIKNFMNLNNDLTFSQRPSSIPSKSTNSLEYLLLEFGTMWFCLFWPIFCSLQCLIQRLLYMPKKRLTRISFFKM